MCLPSKGMVCIDGDRVPEDAYAWIRAHQLLIQPTGATATFLAMNADKDYEAYMDPQGFTIQGPIADPKWDLRLEVAELTRDGGPVEKWAPAGYANTAEALVWNGSAFDVQYVHGPDGLRQNFIVHQRP
ncbi:MAG TPA: hypothetical protein VKG92_09785, partial [Flavobacteriales bacterium]|nr:hypothetical protein [Flavobacteriales bacterium]